MKRQPKAKVWIGTSGWSYPDWYKNFYPAALAKKDWFKFYSHQFNTVEINATFYRSFPKDTYQHWYEQAPKNFLYVIKASRYITHRKYLKEVKDSIKICEGSASQLKDKLGLILLQLPRTMPYDLDRLSSAIKCFRNRHRLVVEFRHKKWLTEETKNLLKKLGVIYCDVDSPDLSLQNWVTADIGYIRLHGRHQWYRSNYTPKALKEIADHAKKMIKQGAKQVFIFFNNDYKAYAAKNALSLKSYF